MSVGTQPLQATRLRRVAAPRRVEASCQVTARRRRQPLGSSRIGALSGSQQVRSRPRELSSAAPRQLVKSGSAPNMAFQRTRRPSLRSGRSLRSLGSPLNAFPLGGTLMTMRLGRARSCTRPSRAMRALRLGSRALDGDHVARIAELQSSTRLVRLRHWTTVADGVSQPEAQISRDRFRARRARASGLLDQVRPAALAVSTRTRDRHARSQRRA